MALVIRILKLELPRQGDTSNGELPAVDVVPDPRRFLPRTDVLSGGLMMTVEEVGTGWKLTYKVVGPDAPGEHRLDRPDAARRQGRSSIGQRQAIEPNDGGQKDRLSSHSHGPKVSGEGDGYLEGRDLARWQGTQSRERLRDLEPQRAGRKADPLLGQAVMTISSGSE